MGKNTEKKKTYAKNKFILIVAMILGIILMAANCSAIAYMKVSLSKYDPYPAIPGQNTKVWLLVQNLAVDDVNDITVQLTPDYPFSIYGNNDTQTIPLLGGNKDYLIDYTVKVDGNATPGDNILKVRVKFNAGQSIVEQIFNLKIDVESTDSTIAISSVTTDPQEISPGSDGKITVSVTNNAQAAFTDLNLKLLLYSNIGTTTDLPFAPIGSTTEQKIYLLNPGETKDFVYTIRTYPDAASKVYKIPFILTYYDASGDQKNKTDYIGVIVNSVPDIAVMIDKTDLSLQKKSGSLTLKFVNKGLNDIKFLNVKILKSDEFDLLSTTDTNYIGNLVSDDYQTAEYKLSIRSSKKQITIPVQVQYRDANNRFYDTTENVVLNLVDAGKLSQANGTGGGSGWTIVIIILIIAGAVFWYFKRKAKKSKKGQF